jgi:diaminopimelate epimerase
MHGIGNDFVLYDELRDGVASADPSLFAKRVCDRKFGVGADGLIIVRKTEHLVMQMFNPDGSESEMCGNGLRVFARLAQDRGYVNGSPFLVETGAGLLSVEVDDASVKIDMGVARLSPAEIGMNANGDQFVNESVAGSIRGTAVSMGNPHLVIFVRDVTSIDLEKDGPVLEHHPLFRHRTNVHFAEVIDAKHIKMRTWERGAGATLACGTGACAVAVAGFLNQLTERSVEAQLPGGSLQLLYLENGHVEMTGPADYVYEGELSSLLQNAI